MTTKYKIGDAVELVNGERVVAATVISVDDRDPEEPQYEAKFDDSRGGFKFTDDTKGVRKATATKGAQPKTEKGEEQMAAKAKKTAKKTAKVGKAKRGAKVGKAKVGKAKRVAREPKGDSGVRLTPDFDRYKIGAAKTPTGHKTVDIDDVTAKELRGLGLDDVRKRAAAILKKAGRDPIDFEKKYGHLNPGMQRMVIGNICRAIVNEG